MYTFPKAKIATLKSGTKLFGQLAIPDTKLIKGPGSSKKVGELLSKEGIKNPLIITDEGLFNLGLLDDMIKSLKHNNLEYSIYKGIKPDPTFAIVKEAMDVCKENDCDAIIGFGGGSTLDTAKTTAASAANKFVDPVKLKGKFKVRKKPLPFVAIPTTAGTGSEVTLVAVISDPKTHQKTTIIDPKLIATYTILDPELTTGLPGPITASTGEDALTHAIEAYISTYNTKKTDELAKKAIKIISENLEKAYNNPTDINARENMLEASMYAGMAFTRTYVGYVHAFSHNIGGKYAIPHGLANAVLLPHVMEDAKEKSKDRFAKLSDLLELTDKNASIEEKADAFIQYLYDLNKKLDIPEKLEDFKSEGIDEIIDAAFAEAHGTYPVPKYYTKEEARTLLEKVSS